MKLLRKTMERMTSGGLARDSFIIFSGTMAANVSAYLYHLFVGRIMGPVGYGELSALLSLFAILNAIAVVLQTILVKYFSILKARNDLGQAKQLFITTTKYLITAAVIGGAIFAFLVPSIMTYLHITTVMYFVFLYLIFFFNFVTTIPVSMIQGFQMFIQAAIFSNIGMWLRLLLGIAGAFGGVAWTLLTNVIANIVGFLAYLYPVRTILSVPARSLSFTKRDIATFGIPAVITTIALTSVFSIDVLLVKHFFTAEIAGIYAAVSVIGRIIYYASIAVGYVAFPVIAERRENKKPFRQFIRNAMSGVALLSMTLTLMYFAVPKQIVSMLYGAGYQTAYLYVGIFGVFISLFSMASLMVNLNLAAGYTGIWIITVVTSILQYVGISLYHGSIWNVITVNGVISGILLFGSILYFFYADKKSEF